MAVTKILESKLQRAPDSIIDFFYDVHWNFFNKDEELNEYSWSLKRRIDERGLTKDEIARIKTVFSKTRGKSRESKDRVMKALSQVKEIVEKDPEDDFYRKSFEYFSGDPEIENVFREEGYVYVQLARHSSVDPSTDRYGRIKDHVYMVLKEESVQIYYVTEGEFQSQGKFKVPLSLDKIKRKFKGDYVWNEYALNKVNEFYDSLI